MQPAPPADQTFNMDVLSGPASRTPATSRLQGLGLRRFLIAMTALFAALGIWYLVRPDRDLFTGGMYLVIALLNALQATRVGKGSTMMPEFALSGAGIRFQKEAMGREQTAAWDEIASIEHGVGRIIVHVRGAEPMVASFASVSYAEAQVMKEATDAWARFKQIPIA